MNQGYHWEPKGKPPIIKHHSVAKHDILRAYLVAYIQTLLASQQTRELKLTLVDGFAGGGIYTHQLTGELVYGSPFIMIDAVKEADFLVNNNRKIPIKISDHYFFIEQKLGVVEVLLKQIQDKGLSKYLNEKIFVRQGVFQQQAASILEFVKKKSPRSARCIFLLDQYGYSQVPAPLIKTILSTLPGAEVILNFAVNSFLNYAGDDHLTQKKLENIGIPDVLRGRKIEDIKASEPDWRLFIQSCLYADLVEACGAKYFTPFFIRSSRGHGDYWLLHLSQHPRARDVMTEIHWKKNNYFIHYGGPGLDMFKMLGFVSDRDRQPDLDFGFCFDQRAKQDSLALLQEQIPQIVSGVSELSFSQLFSSTCNGSPASAGLYKESLGNLLRENEIDIFTKNGGKRKSPNQIQDSDIIMLNKQLRIFF